MSDSSICGAFTIHPVPCILHLASCILHLSGIELACPNGCNGMSGACRQAYPEIKSPCLINYKGGKDGKDAMEAFGSKSP